VVFKLWVKPLRRPGARLLCLFIGPEVQRGETVTDVHFDIAPRPWHDVGIMIDTRYKNAARVCVEYYLLSEGTRRRVVKSNAYLQALRLLGDRHSRCADACAIFWEGRRQLSLPHQGALRLLR
jgi:hypothetical protein